MYTSGCPKNQNKCWYKIGSPPPIGSKNVVLKFRSVNSIVMAPAKTGNDNSNKITVNKTDQMNRGILSKLRLLERMFTIVVMKLIDPRIEEAPAKWSLKIAKSTLGVLWKLPSDRGGYTVHPVPAPKPVRLELLSRNKDGGSSQKLMLFMRGKAMSGAPTIIGINQLPNPPIITGITIKKIITKAWAVTIVL